MSKQRIQFLLEGRVQRVKMRRYVESAARHFQLTGFVFNTSSGQVFGEARGDTNNIQFFSQWVAGQWTPRVHANIKPAPVGTMYPELARVDRVSTLILHDEAIDVNLLEFSMVRNADDARRLEETAMPTMDAWKNAVVGHWPPNVIMAPMVRGSELAFRMLGRKYGCTSAYGPMLRAASILQGNEAHSMSTCPEDRPLVVQLCGNKPHEVAAAAVQIFSELNGEVDGIDFNLGCPQVVADVDNFGAFLASRNPDVALECIRALAAVAKNMEVSPPRLLSTSCSSSSSNSPSTTTTTTMIGRKQRLTADENNVGRNDRQKQCQHHVDDTASASSSSSSSSSLSSSSSSSSSSLSLSPLPPPPPTSTSASASLRRCPQVSAKIRLLPTIEESIEFAKMLESAGCDLISVHCRTPSSKHNGAPDYEAGRLIVNSVNIPVVINGGIESEEKARSVLQQTGAHGVMVAQGLLKNHRMLVDNIPSPSELAAEYLSSCVLHPPPSSLYVRKHLRWIFRDELQPVKSDDPAVFKAQFTDWRPRLWTFLVRPYLTEMIQFQQVVHLYCVLAKIDVPESLTLLNLPTPTFKSIKMRVKK